MVTLARRLLPILGRVIHNAGCSLWSDVVFVGQMKGAKVKTLLSLALPAPRSGAPQTAAGAFYSAWSWRRFVIPDEM